MDPTHIALSALSVDLSMGRSARPAKLIARLSPKYRPSHLMIKRYLHQRALHLRISLGLIPESIRMPTPQYAITEPAMLNALIGWLRLLAYG